MAMKILNQFIDDFVGVFQYRFMDTFQYFKERKKSKYLGDRFEEWVVKNSNISIIRKSKFPQNPKRSVRFSGKRTKRSVQKRKARNTQKAETKVL